MPTWSGWGRVTSALRAMRVRASSPSRCALDIAGCMNVLGISAYYHDSAACLLRNGRIVAAAQEERFTRRRHDAGFPTHAVRACLAEGGIEVRDLDCIAFYDK